MGRCGNGEGVGLGELRRTVHRCVQGSRVERQLEEHDIRVETTDAPPGARAAAHDDQGSPDCTEAEVLHCGEGSFGILEVEDDHLLGPVAIGPTRRGLQLREAVRLGAQRQAQACPLRDDREGEQRRLLVEQRV
jgi:hypothetical protein